MAMEDRPTDTARASMNSRPMRRRPMPRADASSGLSELRSSGRWMTATRASVAALRPMTTGTVDESMVKIDPKRICWRGPGRRALGGVEVEEQRGQAGGGAEHDAGGQVAAPDPLHADQIHGTATDHPAADEADEGAEAEVEGARSPGRGHVGQRVAGERLASDHGEDTDDGRDRWRSPHRWRPRCGPARSRRTRARTGRARAQETVRVGWSGMSPASAPGSATTSTRPWSFSTSTWCP